MTVPKPKRKKSVPIQVLARQIQDAVDAAVAALPDKDTP